MKTNTKNTRDNDLPMSYYRGQNKNTKPKKDKSGRIIPGGTSRKSK